MVRTFPYRDSQSVCTMQQEAAAIAASTAPILEIHDILPIQKYHDNHKQ